METKSNNEINVGIDVGKQHLDIYIRPLEEYFQVENNPEGIASLVFRLKRLEPKRIVIEATGRLELGFVCAASKQGLPVAVIHPTKARRFAGATGKLAKTDKIDARVLAHFGEMLKPSLTEIRSDNVRLISDLIIRRGQLLDMATMEKNRLSIMPKPLHAGLNQVLKYLQKQIEKIEKQLDQKIAAEPQWQEKKDLLMSVKGVGRVLAYTLMSDLPELGQLNNKEIAALVGVAPMNKESGSYKGKRMIRGGRSRIRKALFMSIMSAMQSNPRIKRMYQSLKARGKPSKVAMVACMRKLLTILNQMVKTGQHWNPELG